VAVGVKLELKLSPEYPNAVPEIMLRSIKNVPGKVCQMLEEKLRESAQQNLGDQMVFTLVSIVKEWLDEHNEEDQIPKKQDVSAVEDVSEKEGTPVTVDTYNLWFTEFRVEMEKKKKAATLEVRLNGREWFAKAGSTALVGETATDGAGTTEIDWELFTAEEGDENLDDLALDDEDEEEEKQIGVFREPGTEDQGIRDEVVDDD